MVTEDTAVLHPVFLIVNQSLTIEVEPQGLDIATDRDGTSQWAVSIPPNIPLSLWSLLQYYDTKLKLGKSCHF